MNAITIIFIVILAAIVIRLVSKAVSNDKTSLRSRDDDFHSTHMWSSFGHDEGRHRDIDKTVINDDTDETKYVSYDAGSSSYDSSSYDSDCGGGGD